jgi:hypothetical protein
LIGVPPEGWFDELQPESSMAKIVTAAVRTARASKARCLMPPVEEKYNFM